MGSFFLAVGESCAVYSNRTPVPGYTSTGRRIDEEVGQPGAIRALDPATAGGLVFAAAPEGNFMALDAKNRQTALARSNRREHQSSLMSYVVDGR